ncbi:MAG: DUF4340 domain-containing protein [Bdellovibrio sp.]
MKLKGRTILIIALLVFGGYAVYDFFHDKKIEEKAIEESRLMTINFEQVQYVEIQEKDTKIVLNRTVDGWDLVEPIKDAADSSVVDDFVKNIYPERIIEIAKEGPNIDWALYGLDKPLATITLKTSAGTQNVFEISDKKNFEENVFARRDHENKVLLLNSVWKLRATKIANDFRDRRFLRHKIASVDELKVKNDKGLLDLKRLDGKWLSPSHKEIKIDQNKVREILTAIADAKAAEIYPAETKAKAGKELFSMDLVMADKKWTALVTQTDDLGIYAKISEPSFFMKMESGALDKLIHLNLEELKEGPKQEEKKDHKKLTTDEERPLAEKKEKK